MTKSDKTIHIDVSGDDARYRRPRKPLEVRRRTRWKDAFWISARLAAAAVALAAVGVAAYGGYRFAATSPVFRLGGAEAIEVVEAANVPPEAVRDRFSDDLGGAIFGVPLEERRRALEEIPWVESATVQRLLPNRVRVHLRERTPVAFLRQGSTLSLVDVHGIILTPPQGAAYEFAVLSGISDSQPPEERAARVGLYRQLIADLDRGDKNYSRQLSEIDLSDPDNLRATIPDADGVVLLHFGRDRYQEKFEAYLQHRPLWQQSGETVRAVDLRYRGQIVLNPDSPSEAGGR
ncbi:MAG: cell division protein FtsQ/DivIB [Candidatus Acidiferrales bacterium]